MTADESPSSGARKQRIACNSRRAARVGADAQLHAPLDWADLVQQCEGLGRGLFISQRLLTTGWCGERTMNKGVPTNGQ